MIQTCMYTLLTHSAELPVVIVFNMDSHINLKYEKLLITFTNTILSNVLSKLHTMVLQIILNLRKQIVCALVNFQTFTIVHYIVIYNGIYFNLFCNTSPIKHNNTINWIKSIQRRILKVQHLVKWKRGHIYSV